jgi:hypothetical protein
MPCRTFHENPCHPGCTQARDSTKDAVERLVVELTYRERGERQRAKAGRRIR